MSPRFFPYSPIFFLFPLKRKIEINVATSNSAKKFKLKIQATSAVGIIATAPVQRTAKTAPSVKITLYLCIYEYLNASNAQLAISKQKKTTGCSILATQATIKLNTKQTKNSTRFFLIFSI